jgi:hypothetical protein
VLLKIIYLLFCPELGLFVLMFGADLVKDHDETRFVVRRPAVHSALLAPSVVATCGDVSAQHHNQLAQ